MAGTLATIDMLGPFSYGLNTQDNTSSGTPAYATEAYNCVIDEQGRIASRKGFVLQESIPAQVDQLYSHVALDGTESILAASNGEIFLNDADTSILSGAAGNNWTFVSIGAYVVAAQAGESLVVFEDTTWTEPAITNSAFTLPKIIAGGYGRVWAADTNEGSSTVYWCDLLNPLDWDTGDSGSLDLTTVFVNGTDMITGITVFNNRLVIFCKRSIYVFALPPDDPDPALAQLVDTIDNVGCIARDSIVQAGNDVFFLSEAGLMSLSRLFDSNYTFPINNMTRLVKDQFLGHMLDDDVNSIKATYYPKEGMYLIASPYNSLVYVFNVLLPVPEVGTPRITIWRDTVTPIRSFTVNAAGDLLVGMSDGYYKYSGYGDVNAPYEMTVASQWLTFGEYSRLKHLKKMRMVIIGGGGQVGTFWWAADYKLDFDSVGLVMTQSATKYYYNIAEYGEAEYTGGVVLEEIYENIGGSGRAFLLKLQAPVSGEKIAFQTLQLFANKGKIA